MIDQFMDFFLYKFFLGLASLGIGLAVIAPCLLVPSWRHRILKSDPDIEGLGLIALVVAIIAVGAYNHLAAYVGH